VDDPAIYQVTGGVRLNPVLAEIFKTGLVKTPQGDTLKLYLNVGLEEGILLQQLIGEIEALISPPVGLAYGSRDSSYVKPSRKTAISKLTCPWANPV
jgi:hypothetical protein